MKQIRTLSTKKQTVVFILAFLCIGMMQELSAQVCSNPNNIFGLTAAGGIYPINSTNASVSAQLNTAAYSGFTPNQANAIGYNTINGMFYYFAVNPGASGQEFICYNPTSNLYVTLATSPITSTVHAGCVNFNGTGYYCTDVTGKLYYYNIALNTWTTITSEIVDQYGDNVSTLITTQNSGDMAIDGLGNLWIITSSSANYALYEISASLPTTVQTKVTAKEVIAPTTATPAGASFEGIAFNASGQIYMSTSSSVLYNLENSSKLAEIGTFSTSGVGNDLTSCTFPPSILAVNWESLTVTLNNNAVTVDWSIAQTPSAKGFYVERSADSKNWESLAYVSYEEFQPGYSYMDASPAPGSNYYRIHEMDENNQDNYSDIKMISLSTSSKISVWPNPVINVLNVQENGNGDNMKTQIFDIVGRAYLATTLHSGTSAVDISNLPTGSYIVHITETDGTVYNQKIIKK